MNYTKIMEYIKTTTLLLALLVTVLWLTDILNFFISKLLILIFSFIFFLIALIQNSKENKINPAEENAEIQKSLKKKRQHPICKGIQLVVGLVFISIGAYFGAFDFVTDIVAPIFGGNPIQTEIIDKVGYPVEVSDTYEGITISADKIIGDSHNACVIFTIANEDGTPIVLPEGVSAEDLFYGGECSGAEFPHIKREAEMPSTSMRVVESNGKLQITEMFGADDHLAKIYGWHRHFFKGKNVTARFDNLSYLDENADKSVPISERWVPVLEGRWKFRYEFDYEDTEVTIPVDEQFTRDDLTFTVKDITISPIAIQANYKVDAVPQWSESEESFKQGRKEYDRFADSIELLITKKDGTVVEMKGGGYMDASDEDITIVEKGGLFEEVVPMEEIVSVTVGDVVVPINK